MRSYEEFTWNLIWIKVFKNGPSKICGRQPLKIFTWSILEYFVPYVVRASLWAVNLQKHFRPINFSWKKVDCLFVFTTDLKFIYFSTVRYDMIKHFAWPIVYLSLHYNFSSKRLVEYSHQLCLLLTKLFVIFIFDFTESFLVSLLNDLRDHSFSTLAEFSNNPWKAVNFFSWELLLVN